MRPPQKLILRAWAGAGSGALFTTRHQIPPHVQIQHALIPSPIVSRISASAHHVPLRSTHSLATRSFRRLPQRQSSGRITSSCLEPKALLSTARTSLQQVAAKAYKDEVADRPREDDDVEEEPGGFGKTKKASQAAKLNLSAKLSKGDGSKAGGFGEVWRLIKVARPEARTLSWALFFLIISSAVSMSVPFSIGKILDMATGKEGTEMLFGMGMGTFYLALAGVLTLGAATNYARIIILRIVGERIVTRLRSNLFRKTYVQNAEFFDANRVGDLISRLGSDTIIVGKSITQNLSDGLRSLISGAAGFGMMAYMSVKLTGILALMFPPWPLALSSTVAQFEI